MRRFLVTGGAGFIGAHLVRALVRRGEAVRVVDNLATGSEDNLGRALGLSLSAAQVAVREARTGLVPLMSGCELRVGSILDAAVMAEVCEGVEVVLHQAALRSVPRSIQDPVSTHMVNVTGTVQVLEAARHAGVRRVVFASSSSVYGDTPLPKHEAQTPQPKSPYAASKLAGEAYCHAYTRAFGLSTIALRYFNVYGPWQDPQSEYAAVIPKFIILAMHGEPVPVHGDGQQARDFTYITDVVNANLAAADADVSSAIVNVGAGQRHSLLEFIAIIEGILGCRIRRIHEPPRPGDVRDTEADISLARRILGYRPATDFKTGLQHTVDAMRGIESAGVRG